MFLSRFNDRFEKRVYKFFHKVSTKSTPVFIKSELRQLMQEDLVRVMLILEWKFKGYKKLKKSKRARLYKNLVNLTDAFLRFIRFYEEQELEPGQTLDQEKYLDLIRQFLHPSKYVQYEAGVSFEKLLRDPDKEKLVGDCNQLCALYTYFYSLRFPIQDLKTKLIKGHVCLRFGDQDLECTAGAWTQHDEYLRIANIEELIPIDLLDVNEKGAKTFSLSPETQLKAAELSYTLSSNRTIALKNLKSAYHNLCIHALDQESFGKALSYARKAENLNLINSVIQEKGRYYLRDKQFNRARKEFRKIRNQSLLKMVDQQEINHLIGKLKNCKTVEDYKKKKSTLLHIKKLSYKLNNRKILEFCQDLLKKI